MVVSWRVKSQAASAFSVIGQKLCPITSLGFVFQ